LRFYEGIGFGVGVLKMEESKSEVLCTDSTALLITEGPSSIPTGLRDFRNVRLTDQTPRTLCNEVYYIQAIIEFEQKKYCRPTSQHCLRSKKKLEKKPKIITIVDQMILYFAALYCIVYSKFQTAVSFGLRVNTTLGYAFCNLT
jgi:hypothetical protein